MNEIKRSIFRQKVYAKRYELTKLDIDRYGVFSGPYTGYKIVKTHANEEIGENKLIEINISMPLLDVGDKFYIEEDGLNQLVTITGAYRTSKDAVVYYIEPELIEDDETIVSLKKCDDLITRYNEQQKEIDSAEQSLTKANKKYNDIGWEIIEIKSKWWYKLFNR